MSAFLSGRRSPIFKAGILRELAGLQIVRPASPSLAATSLAVGTTSETGTRWGKDFVGDHAPNQKAYSSACQR